MNVYILCYETFTLFEIDLLSYMFNSKEKATIIGLEKSTVRAYENILVTPEYDVDEITLSPKDLLVIPGGNYKLIPENSKLKALLDTVFEKQYPIAAICAGVEYLDEHGYLKGYRTVKTTDNDVVIDRHLTTAKPNAFVEFALETANAFGVLGDEQGYKETVQFFKNIKTPKRSQGGNEYEK